MQGWRTLAEVAKELGITPRTLNRRLAEVGIRPARPGRIGMLSDADVDAWVSAHDGWRRDGAALVRDIENPSFLDGIELVSRVAHVAE